MSNVNLIEYFRCRWKKGQNSHFNLTVERGGVPWPALVPTPSDVIQEALVLLRVRNSADIREEAGKHINIQVRFVLSALIVVLIRLTIFL